MRNSFLFFLFSCILSGCNRGDCYSFGLLAAPPYSSPVWYPDGSMLGFNHTPIQLIGKMLNGDCGPTYSYSSFSDSDGFWLINRDGSNLRRVTNFELLNPSWSPDGKWIAFCNGAQIYKMSFDGVSFDTANIIELTNDSSNHFYPSWNLTGDSIYFDSDEQNVNAPYQVYKMAADGSGQTLIGNKGIDSIYSREPFCAPTTQILHIRGDSISYNVFTMDGNGNHVKQLTFNTSPYVIGNPRYYNSKIYYQDHGVWSADGDGSGLTMIAGNSEQGFSIAPDGTIAYVNFDPGGSPAIDQTHGVIWIMNPDGSNKTQFTFNHTQ